MSDITRNPVPNLSYVIRFYDIVINTPPAQPSKFVKTVRDAMHALKEQHGWTLEEITEVRKQFSTAIAAMKERLDELKVIEKCHKRGVPLPHIQKEIRKAQKAATAKTTNERSAESRERNREKNRIRQREIREAKKKGPKAPWI